MIFRTESHDESGLLYVEEWDTATQTYTRRDAAGTIVEQRPFTAEESADYAAQEAAQTETANHATLIAEIEQNIDVLLATVDNLNAITDRTNAEINANPATTIKDVAREAKTIARQTVRIARVVSGATESTDSGS